MESPSKKRKTIFKVIHCKKSIGYGARQLAGKFKVGKTQIQSISKNKVEILKSFENNDPSGWKRKSNKIKPNKDINKRGNGLKMSLQRKYQLADPFLKRGL